MFRKRRTSMAADKVELQMTPMIDVVFQLLAFFIMTFRIIAQEGDFNIKMPSVAPQEGPVEEPPVQPVRITLLSDGKGELAGIRYNDTPLAQMSDITGKIVELVGADPGSGPSSLRRQQEVEIHADYGLHYHYTLEAVSRVSGYVSDGRPVSLIEKIKFSRPRPKGSS
jgi:biopolymer transport protein ExbD